MAKRRPQKHLCAECKQRPALYISPVTGRVKAKHDGHSLCRQCHRSLVDRTRAK